MNLDILYEDNHLIAVNKGTSDLVQGDKTGDVSLDIRIREYIKQKYNKPGDVFLGIIHRLDRPVSGVVVFARTSKALGRMNQMFRERSLMKKYWAVVSESPPADKVVLEHYLIKNHKQNRSYAYEREKPGTKRAVLDYRLAGQSKDYYFLEINLHTGRHHQIRCQRAKIGCIIKGDLKYGSKRSDPGGGIHLHARQLEFLHPVTKEKIKMVADPPAENDSLWQEFLKLPGC